jgi:hypothetical protein
MGCQMMATLDSGGARAQKQLASASGWFEGWEQSLSRFRPESELSHNRHAAGSR